MYGVVRLRGDPGASGEILDTLKMLNLKGKFNCTLVPENESYEGMLQKVKNFVTWGEINEDTLEELVGRVGGNVEVAKVSKELLKGKTMKEVGLKPTITLSPPSRGLKGSIKELYPGGEAGYRGEEINQLLKRMV